jgi:hypothetical protein
MLRLRFSFEIQISLGDPSCTVCRDYKGPVPRRFEKWARTHLVCEEVARTIPGSPIAG